MTTEPDNQRRILVVDDERLNVEVLVSLLRNDYKMMVAKNGEQALRVVSGDVRPDLVLLDVMMPDMDGFEVCRRLKSMPDVRDIPVVFVSAMGEEVDEMRGLEVGGVDYITKPISPPIVQARVRTHLSLYDHARRLAAQAKELAEFNANLEQRVKDGVAEVERLGRLKRFFTPSVADLLLGQRRGPLRSYRRRSRCSSISGLHRVHKRGSRGDGRAPRVPPRDGRADHQARQRLERFAGDGIRIFFKSRRGPESRGASRSAAVEMQAAFRSLRTGTAPPAATSRGGTARAGPATIGAIGSGRQTTGPSVTNLAALPKPEAPDPDLAAGAWAVPGVPGHDHELKLKGFSDPWRPGPCQRLRGSALAPARHSPGRRR
jgi:CheY-like chemotaxis protein